MKKITTIIKGKNLEEDHKVLLEAYENGFKVFNGTTQDTINWPDTKEKQLNLVQVLHDMLTLGSEDCLNHLYIIN